MKRQRDKAHLAAVASCPCVICGNPFVQVAHIRYSVPGRPNPGVGRKPDDRYTIPLCEPHHREQHSRGERLWWESKGIDPLAVADKLYEASGDLEKMEKIIKDVRK